MCIAQFRVTLNSNTNADPMMIAGQKAFPTSFILVSLLPRRMSVFYGPTGAGVSIATMSVNAVEVKICSNLNRSSHAQSVAADSWFEFWFFEVEVEAIAPWVVVATLEPKFPSGRIRN
jgi:hypothetical protein